MADKLVPFMYQSWDDLDHAFHGVDPIDAVRRIDGASSMAWTVGHATNTIEALINRRLAGLPRHRLLGKRDFGTGGSGDATDWQAILEGVSEVREGARRFLASEPDLDLVVPYDGSVAYLRESGLTLRYALMAVAAHHFLHAGEIIALRFRMGDAVPDVVDWGRGLVANG